MKLTSKIDAVTLFPRGAEITRLAKFELEEGEHELILSDLPEGLIENSLRVEGEADGGLMIGAVDSRTVHIERDSQQLDASKRRDIRQQIQQLKDEASQIDGRMQTAATQKNLMDSLAAMPGSPRCPKTDWGKIYDLIGERLPKAHETINKLTIERRQIQKKIDNLAARLADVPVDPKRQFEVGISARADTKLSGQLTLRYQIAAAGWQPFYDGRLVTNPVEGEPELDLVRRAQIHQQTSEPWDEVALTLSTTRPSGGTSAPDLPSDILDILQDHPPMPVSRGKMRKQVFMAAPVGAMADEMEEASPETVMMKASEVETGMQETGFQASFKVPGRVSLQGDGTQKKVRLGGQKLSAKLQIRSTPLLDPTAYLYAGFKHAEGVALLPGRISLYRDGVYVGNGDVPLVNVGERHELGFGADDKVILKRIEVKRAKGRHGLIKSENTDEFHYRIEIDNHHTQDMPVRILDRIPASNHEKLRIEWLDDMSQPSEKDVDDKRGVLAFERDLAAGGKEVVNIHYRMSWPKGERIG